MKTDILSTRIDLFSRRYNFLSLSLSLFALLFLCDTRTRQKHSTFEELILEASLAFLLTGLDINAGRTDDGFFEIS